jgi:hypothetical protein
MSRAGVLSLERSPGTETGRPIRESSGTKSIGTRSLDRSPVTDLSCLPNRKLAVAEQPLPRTV